MSPKSFVLDGSRFSNLEQFYDEVEKILTKGLDYKIGRNLDAFNDVLRGDFGAFESDELIQLIWKHSDKSKKDFGWKETIKYIEDKLENCHPSNKESVREDLSLARGGKGETLFDLVLSIIREHKHIKLVLQ